MLQIAELAQIRQQRLKETNQEMPKAQDGLPTFLPPGSQLPEFFGFKQAAEKATGTTRYDPKKHKMTPFQVHIIAPHVCTYCFSEN